MRNKEVRINSVQWYKPTKMLVVIFDSLLFTICIRVPAGVASSLSAIILNLSAFQQ